MKKDISAICYSTSVNCPLSCKYCYIPKTSYMKEYHNDVVKLLSNSDLYVPNNLKNNITYLSLWGAEPFTTLNIITDKLDDIKVKLPKLKSIYLSSSFAIPSGVLSDFIHKCDSVGIDVDVQISLDGPSYITDINRFKGASEIVPKNFFNCLEQIQDIDNKVEFHWKSTITIDNMKTFNSNISKIKDYCRYFRDLNNNFTDINRNDNITLVKNSYYPTLMVPGSYTKSDGVIFYKYLKNLEDLGEYSTYSFRLKKLFDFSKYLGNRKDMFTCSGGDTQIGLDGEELIHICHRSFMLNNENYLASISDEIDTDNWDVVNMNKGTLEIFKDKYIIKENDFIRWRLINQCYHNYWKMSLSSGISILKELAISNQVDKEYLDNDRLSFFLSLYLNTALSCPADNITETGMIYTITPSQYRMFGNGAFKLLLERYYNEL